MKKIVTLRNQRAYDDPQLYEKTFTYTGDDVEFLKAQTAEIIKKTEAENMLGEILFTEIYTLEDGILTPYYYKYQLELRKEKGQWKRRIYELVYRPGPKWNTVLHDTI